MACTIDHLRMDIVVRVLHDFVDLRGTAGAAGCVARILALRCDVPGMRAEIDWEFADGKRQTLQFDLKLREGPGIGRMRQYFEELEAVDAARHFPPRPRTVPYRVFPAPQPRPTPSLAMPDGLEVDAAIERVAALVFHHRHDQAEACLRALLDVPAEHDGILLDVAEGLCRQGLWQVGNPDRSVYEWLKQRGMSLWYAWGAGATSGGEGTYRGMYIRKAERAFAEAEQASPSWTPP